MRSFLPARLLPYQIPDIFNFRHRSLTRGNLLVWLSVIASFFLSDFPHNRATPLLILPTLGVLVGTADTLRCIRKRWSFYHAGVLLCLYMDLMAVSIILFLLIYPYARPLAASS